MLTTIADKNEKLWILIKVVKGWECISSKIEGEGFSTIWYRWLTMGDLKW